MCTHKKRRSSVSARGASVPSGAVCRSPLSLCPGFFSTVKTIQEREPNDQMHAGPKLSPPSTHMPRSPPPTMYRTADSTAACACTHARVLLHELSDKFSHSFGDVLSEFRRLLYGLPHDGDDRHVLGGCRLLDLLLARRLDHGFHAWDKWCVFLSTHQAQ